MKITETVNGAVVERDETSSEIYHRLRAKHEQNALSDNFAVANDARDKLDWLDLLARFADDVDAGFDPVPLLERIDKVEAAQAAVETARAEVAELGSRLDRAEDNVRQGLARLNGFEIALGQITAATDTKTPVPTERAGE